MGFGEAVVEYNDQITSEQLYALGLAHFRENRWEEAIQAFTALQERGDRYPELANLIADAQLKLELARTSAPITPVPTAKKPNRMLLAGAIALGVLVLGISAYVLTRPQTDVVRARPTQLASLPTLAPTSTGTPAPTRQPTMTPRPSPTLEPTITPVPEPTIVRGPGTLTVRTPDGVSLTRVTRNIALIFDASGSMLALLDGRPKIDIAREALGTLIEQLPDSTSISLRSYGHRRARDCTDTELLVPFEALDRAKLLARVNAIQAVPNGRTPIGLSLQETAKDIASASGDTLIVLVTDGEETCDANPVAIAAEIRAANPQVRIAVIGFSLDDTTRSNVGAIATSGGGNYYDAADAAQLKTALQQAIVLPIRIYDSADTEVFSGVLGDSTDLPAGTYRVVIGGDTPLEVQKVTVGAEATTIVEIREANGKLNSSVVLP